MSYRVIQWATGNVGRAAIEGIAAHPELELVGCWVSSGAKAGRDAGEIAGIDALGVTATTDKQAIYDLDADCVVYSPMLADEADVHAILASGKNLVTPVGWVYPFKSTDLAALEGVCRQAEVTLHGTGIHPGGITERFPLMLSSLCTGIRHVRAEEFSDIRSYATEFVVREIMMFGKTAEQAAASGMADLLGHGFCQSIDMIADAMGWELDDEKRVVHETAVATAPIDTPVGVLETGTVAAQRFRWQGTVDGQPVITAAVNWLMGEEHLDPPWDFGPEGQRFEIAFDADPPLSVTFHGIHPATLDEGIERNAGIVATAMHCVNAVPYVCAAEPGIKTYLDLPLIAGRAGS
ncbi:MAG: hypothetical protein JNK12_23335 [Acidimicrobiales bacterium]|nr:hypothetical protein [Acidimicrobiales bacterium]